MASTAILGSYLSDHLGGADAGVEIARHLHRRAAGGTDSAVLATLAADIEQDRDELRGLVELFGGSSHPIKQAAGWIAGRTHRIAVDELMTGDEHLSMLLGTESLALGIEGKAALWQALLAILPAYPQLTTVDIARLVERAGDQRDRIETVRIAAALRAFTTPH